MEGQDSWKLLSFDQDAQTVSGTFSFLGVREQLDANGDPVLDSSGNPLYESRTISDGAFNSIPFDVNDTGGGGGGGDGGDDPTDPEDSFFANVEGVEFEDIEFVVNQTTVGGVPMLNVIATRANGGRIRIDIPEDFGVGTYDFTVPISDGTDLIALYNDGDGGGSLTSGSGSITFTEFSQITGKIAATFQFEASDPLDPASIVIPITEGEFNVDFLPSSGGATTVFTAEIDTEIYEPTSVEVTEEPFGDDVTLVTITTINADTNKSVTIQFPNDIAVGTYEMSPSFSVGDEKVGYYNPDVGNSIVFTSNPGTLTISSREFSSGIIEGSFSFTGVDPNGINPTTYEISNGTFVVTVQ